MSSWDIMAVAELFVAVYLLQFYLSYLQMKHITRQYLELTDEYKGEYFIGTNRKKKTGCNPIVILATDRRNMIQEFYMLSGLLVTTRIGRADLEEGVNTAEPEHHKNYLRGRAREERSRALQDTAENIMNYC